MVAEELAEELEDTEAQLPLHCQLPTPMRTSNGHLVPQAEEKLEPQEAQIELSELAPISPKTYGAQVVALPALEDAANLQTRNQEAGNLALEVAASLPQNLCLANSQETEPRASSQDQLSSAEMAS